MMDVFILLILCIFGLIAGVVVTSWEIKRKNWPSVSASINAAEVVQDYGSQMFYDNNTAIQLGILGLAYSIELSYTFDVKGKTYSGKSTKLKSDKRISKEQAEERMKINYQPGTKIEVFYNPKNPSVSMLDKGDVAWGLLIIVWSIISIMNLIILSVIYQQ
jgi:hypothetical protein